MKKLLLLLVCCVVGMLCYAQTNTYWKLGYHTGLDFNSGSPTINPLDTCNTYMAESNTSVCDNQGRIIFYSNGMKVYNRIDKEMQNGNNFNHGTWSDVYINAGGTYPLSQGAIAIPFPNDTNKFYMFYENMEWDIDGLYVPDKLQYLVVDKSLNGGLGDVTIKDQIVIQNDTLACGQLLATKHGNGNDYWLIVRKYRSDVFYKILINGSGVQSPTIQHIGIPYPFTGVYFGQSNFNVYGNKALYLTSSFINSPIIKPVQLDLFNFDRCSGLLSPDTSYLMNVLLDSLDFICGCFSPNSRFLYLSNGRTVQQLDLQNPFMLLNSNRIILKHVSTLSTGYFGNLVDGTDSKIYIAGRGGCLAMSVINSPNLIGVSCNFIENQINFGGAPHYSNGGLPNVPNFALGAITPCGNVGITEPKPEESFTVYPNPARDEITINTSQGSIKSIQVYDVLGRSVVCHSERSEESKSIAINVSKLSAGIYFLKATYPNGVVKNVKFVKE